MSQADFAVNFFVALFALGFLTFFSSAPWRAPGSCGRRRRRLTRRKV